MIPTAPSAYELIRSARERAGMSRSALARKAGVATTTVSRIELGLSEPTYATLVELLTATGGTIEITVAAPAEPSLASAVAHAIDPDTDAVDWLRLRAFADWVDGDSSRVESALAHPPADTSEFAAAFAGAFAEAIAHRHNTAAPPWTRTSPHLSQPWAQSGTPRMIERAAARTPEAFRRRGFTLDSSALFHERAAERA